jgi:ribosomal protein S8
MQSLSSFLILLNQATRRRKTAVEFPYNRLIKNLSVFLVSEGYFSSVTHLGDKLTISFVYSNGYPPFRYLRLASKPSRLIYVRNSARLPYILILSNSESGFTIKHPTDTVTSGKALIQIF